MTTQATLTADDVRKLYEQVKAWGRWGPDDERGALNLITDAKRRQAAQLVQRGVTVSASLPMAKAATPENLFPVMHLMLRAGDIPDLGSAADYFAMAPHGMAHTHLDALCHFFDEGLLYNGFPQTRVTSMGTTALSIESGANGIISRGVLLDVPRAKGREWLEPGEPIFPEDLDKAEQMAGLQVEEGDILLLRTGRHRRVKEVGPWNGRETLAGMYATCLPWLSERNIALLGCDGVSDVLPSLVEGIRQPIHVGTLVYMGVHLLDNADLEPLASACAEYGRWEFLFALCPLKLGQGTASPVNPIAMF
jgi:kynurenine formamidase